MVTSITLLMVESGPWLVKKIDHDGWQIDREIEGDAWFSFTDSPDRASQERDGRFDGIPEHEAARDDPRDVRGIYAQVRLHA